jgi:outer membrane PBP1 activator LpoA protein
MKLASLVIAIFGSCLLTACETFYESGDGAVDMLREQRATAQFQQIQQQENYRQYHNQLGW